MSTREFGLGAVLSVTTGRVLAPVADIHEVLDFLTGDKLFTHQLPRAMCEVAPVVRAAHPELAGIEAPDFGNDGAVYSWVAEQVARFGPSVTLTAAPEAHVVREPLAELAEMMRPDQQTIAVVTEP
jgi:hypothetical protein